MGNDLLIKINADAKNAKAAYDDLRGQTEDLEDQLKTAAFVSGAAFAALTAEIYLSVEAFESQDSATRKLSAALQNQGIFSQQLIKTYREYASQVQEVAGLDDDAVVRSQALVQGYLGQTKVTKDLTFAMADLAEFMGTDLKTSADLVGKSIGSNTNALARYGLQLNTTDTEAQKMKKTLDFINTLAGGMAAAANQGVGSIKQLKNTIGDFQENIGQRFEPIITAAIHGLIRFFEVLNQHPIVADLAASLIVAGTAVTGLVTAVALGVPAFLALQAAAATFGVTLNATLAGIPLLIGAIVAGVTFMALNWQKSMAIMSSAAHGAVVFISELFKGLGNIILGATNLDPTLIKKGMSELTESFKKSAKETEDTYAHLTASVSKQDEKQNAAKKAFADKQAQIAKEKQALLVSIARKENELLQLQNEHASAALIQLKTKEIQVLKALSTSSYADQKALLTKQHEEIVALEKEQEDQDRQRTTEFAQLQNDTQAELAAQGIQVQAQLHQDKLAELRATAQTEADIDRKLQEDMLTEKIKTRNQELLDRKKYGLAVATLNKNLNSQEVQGVKSASQELIALQQSKNSTLKAIGKAAAISNITISTAESAENVYKGFSTIPIIGPALGIAAAAAAIAFGAERIGQVVAAASGGLIEGGVPGVDSVPALLSPGELVVPKKNFSQVVGAVQGQGSNQNNGAMLEVLKSIDSKFSSPTITNVNGDLMADDAFIDSLIHRISDALEFRNAKLYGVTA